MNAHNLSCINLILTSNAKFFQNTNTGFTGLSNFHKLVLTVFKHFTESKPQKITDRGYKCFNTVRFNEKLVYVLAKEKNTSFTKFEEIFLKILNKHASPKAKLLRRKSPIVYLETLKKSYHKEVLPRKTLFQKTHRSLLKK